MKTAEKTENLLATHMLELNGLFEKVGGIMDAAEKLASMPATGSASLSPEVGEALIVAAEATQLYGPLSQVIDVAEAMQNDALLDVAEATALQSMGAVSEAIEQAGGAFVVAEALMAVNTDVAEAIEGAGGAFAVAEALSTPGRAVLHEVAEATSGAGVLMSVAESVRPVFAVAEASDQFPM